MLTRRLRRARSPERERRSLEHELRGNLEGEVRFEDGDRALYATDASNYRQTPIGVVIPRHADDVLRALEICRAFEAPILSRGSGTSIAGQCCNRAVILDYTKYMNRILELDPQRRLARVQPGVVCDALRREAEQHQLTFGPDPATHAWCSIGGMIGNNSCGTHSQMAGRTSDNVRALEIATYDGLRMHVGATSDLQLRHILAGGGERARIYQRLDRLRARFAEDIRARFPRIPRRISGYNLPELLPEHGFHVARSLVGSEGTCVAVLEATVELVPSPPERVLVVAGFEDIFAAADVVPEAARFSPIALEGIDRKFLDALSKKQIALRDLALFPRGRGFLLIELGGDSRGAVVATARDLVNALRKSSTEAKIFEDRREQKQIWNVREHGLGATAHVPGEPDNFEGWEDAAVDPRDLGAYLRDFRALLDRYEYEGSLYGHFGQGCVHVRISFDLRSARGISRFRSFLEDAAELVVRYGGSFSGEHGDGQARAELLPKMFGGELIRAFEEMKSIWDPRGLMNPGKIVRPRRIVDDLRLGADYRPPQVTTYFSFAGDQRSFAKATERCVGVGKCRKDEGTMCPSYMVTREEKHSTRGRARLLFEMLRGDPLADGFDSKYVEDALGLCLACKGCKSECPVNVDLATYKAEFLAHHYRGRLRPKSAYLFGFLPLWLKLARRVPVLANLLTRMPGARWIAGISRQRSIPQLAPENFRDQFAKNEHRRSRASTRNAHGGAKNEHGGAGSGLPRVMLWPDTFNDHFHPEVARAAVRVLEDAGFEVVLPAQRLCCGRPLYDFGWLEIAKRWLGRILENLAPVIDEGIPIVVLEPSCAAVFKDELVAMFPDDPRARRLSAQTFTLAEHLLKNATHYRMPSLDARVLFHGHCHQRALIGIDAERELLARMGARTEVSDSGCCGMAGAFGFEREHYQVSVACGERVLLPAVRAADSTTLLVTDGFSCREQIAQCTDRRALHFAEVLELALDDRLAPAPGERPERKREAHLRATHLRAILRAVALAGGALAAGLLTHAMIGRARAARARHPSHPNQRRAISR